MTLVVHVAGLADLGIDAKGAKTNPLREERLCRLNQLHEELEHSLNEAGLQELRDLTIADTPIGSLLQRFSHNDENLHLLTVGTTQGSGATLRILKTLEKSIHILKAHHPDFQRLTLHSFFIPTLSPADVGTAEETLQALCQDHDQRFLLLGGGATSIVVTLAGLLDQLTGGEWAFLPLTEAAQGIPELISRPTIHADALNAWLMALGLPTEVESSSVTNNALRDTVISANKAFEVALNPHSHSTYTPDDIARSMALVTYCDVARGDLAAGLSIRAWIEREYQRQHALESDAFDAFSEGGTLGTVIDGLKDRSHPLEDCNAWLVQQEEFKDAGIGATHDWVAPSQGLPSATHSSDSASHKDLYDLTLEALSPTLDRPTWLSWPEPKACVIYVQGPDRDAQDRPSIPAQLLNAPQPEKLQRAIGYPHQPTNLSVLCVSTEQSQQQAQRIQEALGKSETSENSWSPRPENFIIIQAPTNASSTALSTLESQIESHIRGIKPRALLVAATGNKELALTCLLAAQDAGATLGIPVFLFSTRSEPNGTTTFDYHQYGLSVQHRQAILQVAKHCAERFDFYTAGRILSMGDTTLVSLSDTAFLLASYLQEARTHRTEPSYAPRILNVLEAVANLFDSNSLTIDAQLRLITIVRELISLEKVRKDLHPLHASVSRTHGGDISTMGSWELLGCLVEVRDRIPLNHGNETLTNVMSDVAEFATQAHAKRDTPLRTQKGQVPTYAELLRAALKAARSRAQDLGMDTSADKWFTHFNKLRNLTQAPPTKFPAIRSGLTIE